MLIKEASARWNISERRIRKLIELGRINNAKKLGTVWYIPEDVPKPIDRRYKLELPKYDLDNRYFKDLETRTKLLKKQKEKTNTKNIELELLFRIISENLTLLGMQITPQEVRKITLLEETIPNKSLSEHILVRNTLKAYTSNNKRMTYIEFKNIYEELTFGLINNPIYREKTSLEINRMLDKYYKIRVSNPYLAAAYIHTMVNKIRPFSKFNSLFALILLNITLLSKGIEPIVIPSKRLNIYKESLSDALNNDYTNLLKMIIIEENNILDTYEKILSFS